MWNVTFQTRNLQPTFPIKALVASSLCTKSAIKSVTLSLSQCTSSKRTFRLWFQKRTSLVCTWDSSIRRNGQCAKPSITKLPKRLRTCDAFWLELMSLRIIKAKLLLENFLLFSILSRISVKSRCEKLLWDYFLFLFYVILIKTVFQQ